MAGRGGLKSRTVAGPRTTLSIGYCCAIIYEGAGDRRIPFIDILWDLPDDPDGNIQHVAEHGLTPADVEFALNHPLRSDTSHSSGRPIQFGRTPSGEKIVVVYEETDDSTVYPVTAYPVED